ncbi:extracellular solute-binding protein [Paenibacillus sp. WQ 127069]|uniref:Extracellular solute-binding protein n=1 Tax=Paenibacillus baimaensis TaxID=2982185 RepID=A0ABT2UKG7_9BACL|nr:extracellular solute-binding protein [Paenibacillus sp. WQ 127069]MCU6794382.1 extracellular solute-binding protein [Paenibacillus sp. WQ 127069]
MFRKRKGLSALITILLSVSLAACSTGKDLAEQGKSSDGKPEKDIPAGPFAKFPETITVKYGKPSSVDVKLPPGDSQENNEFVRFISDKLNIKYEHTWQTPDGDPYKQKIDLVIASGDVPDVMFVNETQLKLLVNSDLVADLTSAYDKNISPELRKVFDSTKELSLSQATFNGKLMAIPNSQPGADAMNVLYIRKDWLDKLGLPEPKTLSDIENVAKAFIERDPGGNGKNNTLGLTGTQDIINIGSSIFGFDTIFSYYDAYPELWIKNKSGNVEYGSIQPENKAALAKLREMYAAGIIHKEFVAETTSTGREKVISGKVGMFFGPFWMGSFMLMDSVKQNPQAEWIPLAVPLDGKGNFKTHTMSPTSSFLVISKKFKHPEAVIRTLNHEYIIDQSLGVDFYKGQNVPYKRVNLPFGHMMAPFDEKEIRVSGVDKVIAGKADYNSLPSPEKLQYDRIKFEKENPKKDLTAWSTTLSSATTRAMLQDNVIKTSGVFYGKTPTMGRKWVNLKKMEDEVFIKIIMGSKPLEAFDEFVTEWKKLGGDEITNEVRGMLKQ